MSDQIKVPTCKHCDMTVVELEADGYVMEDMPLCEMCSYDEIKRLEAELEKETTEKVRVISERTAAMKDNERLREALEKAQGELINLQPHIPQACKPNHESFIDAYVDQALVTIEEALK